MSLAGESLADAQVTAFREEPANAGKVCGRGLRRYSRHPNDFFEWLVWCAFALRATPARLRMDIVGLSRLMLRFLHRVTGIPLTEEQAGPKPGRGVS